MNGGKKVDLSDWQTQKKFLMYLRLSGKYKIACKQLGINIKTVERHKEKDTDFNEACELVRYYAKLRRRLETGIEVKAKAYTNLVRKLDADEVDARTLVKILETSFVMQ